MIQMFHTSMNGINQIKSSSMEMNFLKINGTSKMAGGQSNDQGNVVKPYDICSMVSLSDDKTRNCTSDASFLQQVILIIFD